MLGLPADVKCSGGWAASGGESVRAESKTGLRPEVVEAQKWGWMVGRDMGLVKREVKMKLGI